MLELFEQFLNLVVVCRRRDAIAYFLVGNAVEFFGWILFNVVADSSVGLALDLEDLADMASLFLCKLDQSTFLESLLLEGAFGLCGTTKLNDGTK